MYKIPRVQPYHTLRTTAFALLFSLLYFSLPLSLCHIHFLFWCHLGVSFGFVQPPWLFVLAASFMLWSSIYNCMYGKAGLVKGLMRGFRVFLKKWILARTQEAPPYKSSSHISANYCLSVGLCFSLKLHNVIGEAGQGLTQECLNGVLPIIKFKAVQYKKHMCRVTCV